MLEIKANTNGWLNIEDAQPTIELYSRSRDVLITDGREYTIAKLEKQYNETFLWVFSNGCWAKITSFPYWHEIPKLGV